MAEFELVIGNKTLSSWSLRPWIALVHLDIPFDEHFVRLRGPDTKRDIAAVSPSGAIPVLRHQGQTIWESLAILEYLADLFPEHQLWPEDRRARAHARSVAAEMHSGFREVRQGWPMNLRRKPSHRMLDAEGERQRARIETMWAECRERFGAGGPFLFGRFTAADAMYAPVVTRFETYGGDLQPATRAYCDAMLATPAMRRWYEEAAAETWPEPSPDE